MNISLGTSEKEAPDTAAEFRVSLRILGEKLDFDAISKSLGVNPSRTHRAGDSDILGQKFDRDMWTYMSPLPLTASFEDHIGQLSSTLKAQIDPLQTISRCADVSVVCNYRIYETDQGGFSLSRATVNALDELGLGVEFHIMVI